MSDGDTGRGKIFCIGFPKTGTTSLEVALQQLGYKVCRGNGRNNHSNYLMALCVQNDFDELSRMIRHFDAFADMPWGGTDLYLWLSARYPDAKFIHTYRTTDAWYRSLGKTFLEVDPNPETALESNHAAGAYGAVLIVRKIWGVSNIVAEKERVTAMYDRMNTSIRTHFSGQDRFVSFDLTQSGGWADLCGFLGKPIPQHPFPFENPAGGKTP